LTFFIDDLARLENKKIINFKEAKNFKYLGVILNEDNDNQTDL